MKVLVTGASGFMGGHLARTLAGRHHVIGTTRGAALPPGIEPLRVDLAQQFDTSAWPEVDAIFHLAQAPDYAAFPAGAVGVFNVSAGATQRLLDFAVRVAAKRFVLASTGGLYRATSEPVGEDDALDIGIGPLAHYFAAKRCAELLVEAYRRRIPSTIARVFFCYGPGQSARMLMPRLLSSVRGGLPLKLQGRSGLVFNPVHVADCSAAFSALAEQAGPDVLNLAGPRPLSLREAGGILGRIAGREPVFEVDESATASFMVADTTRMRQLVSKPMIDPVDGFPTLA